MLVRSRRVQAGMAPWIVYRPLQFKLLYMCSSEVHCKNSSSQTGPAVAMLSPPPLFSFVLYVHVHIPPLPALYATYMYPHLRRGFWERLCTYTQVVLVSGRSSRVMWEGLFWWTVGGHTLTSGRGLWNEQCIQCMYSPVHCNNTLQDVYDRINSSHCTYKYMHTNKQVVHVHVYTR